MHKQALASFALILVSLNASAASYSTDLLNIEVQPWSYHSWIPDMTDDSAAGTSAYEILADGIKFTSGEYIFGGGDDMNGGPTSDSGALVFDVTALKFLAKPGYKVTGYELSFSGQYRLSNPATVGVGGELMPVATFPLYTQHYSGGFNWTPYSFSTVIGAGNPAGGAVSARGIIGFDAPGIYEFYDCCDEEGNPIEYLYDVSWAHITIDSVSITASVAAIPEPRLYLMFLAGIGAVAWRARRAARQSSMT